MTRHHRLALRVALLAGVATFALDAVAADPKPKHEMFHPGADHAAGLSPDTAGTTAPLHAHLQGRTYPVSTASAEAQRYYDQGITLAWAFNHEEARRSFRAAQELDPTCAMCFWGEAFALGPNINDGMHDDAVAPAFAAISRARDLMGGASPRERALIVALAERYAPDGTADRAALDRAWADAMRGVADAYPDDPDILTLFADALMNLQPWDYWEADGHTPKGAAADIVAALEQALAIDPDHPAAAHLYIHAVEASATPERAEDFADRLRAAAPAAGHLVHMPAHIYARVGRHADSLAVNRAAVAADETMLAAIGDAASPLFRYGYYPHNVHFLLIAAHFSGAREDAIDAAEKLGRITSEDVSRDLAWVQAIMTAPYTAHAQFSDTATVTALPQPDGAFPFVTGFWCYARAVALARAGDIDAATDEVARIEGIIADADLSGLEAQYLPARDVLSIAALSARAQIARTKGAFEEAEDLLRRAIALESGISYMEPPYWYSPVQQTLGGVLLQDGRAEEAVEAFEAALATQPNNGWAVWGLSQAKRAMGDTRGAAAADRALDTVWVGDRALLTLDRL